MFLCCKFYKEKPRRAQGVFTEVKSVKSEGIYKYKAMVAFYISKRNAEKV